jgi:hypothetical protein
MATPLDSSKLLAEGFHQVFYCEVRCLVHGDRRIGLSSSDSPFCEAGCNAFWVVKQIATGFTRRNLPFWEKAIPTDETAVQVATFHDIIMRGAYPSKLPLILLWQYGTA